MGTAKDESIVYDSLFRHLGPGSVTALRGDARIFYKRDANLPQRNSSRGQGLTDTNAWTAGLPISVIVLTDCSEVDPLQHSHDIVDDDENKSQALLSEAPDGSVDRNLSYHRKAPFTCIKSFKLFDDASGDAVMETESNVYDLVLDSEQTSLPEEYNQGELTDKYDWKSYRWVRTSKERKKSAINGKGKEQDLMSAGHTMQSGSGDQRSNRGQMTTTANTNRQEPQDDDDDDDDDDDHDGDSINTADLYNPPPAYGGPPPDTFVPSAEDEEARKAQMDDWLSRLETPELPMPNAMPKTGTRSIDNGASNEGSLLRPPHQSSGASDHTEQQAVSRASRS